MIRQEGVRRQTSTEYGASDSYRVFSVTAELTALGAVQYTKRTDKFDYDESGRKRTESKGITNANTTGLVTKYWCDRVGTSPRHCCRWAPRTAGAAPSLRLMTSRHAAP
ncbi:hypothetical protein [Ideonella sp. YS5]|uniref:hypothetical protein n=1 Tax=Ideonella sp. YS5 TaxID=3453714 RepID=UPI003EE993E8